MCWVVMWMPNCLSGLVQQERSIELSFFLSEVDQFWKTHCNIWRYQDVKSRFLLRLLDFMDIIDTLCLWGSYIVVPCPQDLVGQILSFSSSCSHLHCVGIFTNYMLYFQAFSRHNPSPSVWPVFRILIPLLIKRSLEIESLHVPGTSNSPADALSCNNVLFINRVFPTIVSVLFSSILQLLPASSSKQKSLVCLCFKQAPAFSVSLSDHASVLAPTTIFKYNCAFNSFSSFCQNYDFQPIPSINLSSMYILVNS